jgi:hypothetical protein
MGQHGRMRADRRRVYDLFLLNITLQMFDAVATYQGIKMGVNEANPILISAFQVFGVGPALLLFKAKACGLLFLLSRNQRHYLVLPALTLLAGVYFALSLVPWVAKFSVAFVGAL